MNGRQPLICRTSHSSSQGSDPAYHHSRSADPHLEPTNDGQSTRQRNRPGTRSRVDAGCRVSTAPQAPTDTGPKVARLLCLREEPLGSYEKGDGNRLHHDLFSVSIFGDFPAVFSSDGAWPEPGSRGGIGGLWEGRGKSPLNPPAGCTSKRFRTEKAPNLHRNAIRRRDLVFPALRGCGNMNWRVHQTVAPRGRGVEQLRLLAGRKVRDSLYVACMTVSNRNYGDALCTRSCGVRV